MSSRLKIKPPIATSVGKLLKCQAKFWHLRGMPILGGEGIKRGCDGKFMAKYPSETSF